MAVIGWILLSVLALIVLLLVLPVRVCIEYLDKWNGKVYLLGLVPVYTFPPSKPQTPKSPPSSGEAPAEKPPKPKPSFRDEIKGLYQKDGVSGVVEFFKRLLSIALGALSGCVRFISVRRLLLCVRVGGKEADEIALDYGKLTAALYPTLTALSEVLTIRRKQILIKPDFLSERIEAKMRMVVWVFPFGVMSVAVAALVKAAVLWFHKFDKQTVKKPLSTNGR